MSPWRRQGSQPDPEPAGASAFLPVNPGNESYAAAYDAPASFDAVMGFQDEYPVGPTTETIDPRVAVEEHQELEEVIEVEVATPRGGRNMGVAAITGLTMFAVVVALAWYDTRAFAALVAIAVVFAVVEWRAALEPQGRHLPLVPVLAATVGMIAATLSARAEGLAVAVLVGCVGVVAWRVADERIDNTLADAMASMLTLMWIPFLASFLLLMAMAEDGWIRVVIAVLAIAGNDTGALFSGMLFGKHKMAPRISPKKTWEGGIGGALIGVGLATGAAYYLLDERWWIGALVGGAAVVAGVIGDLAESVLKRDIQIKDMSSVIPGHGGVLDRMDSTLFGAPAAYVVFAVLIGTV